MKLSIDRAATVRQMIIDECLRLDPNFDVTRIASAGYGATNPVVPNDNDPTMTAEQREAAQAENRRAEVVLIPNGTLNPIP